LQVNPRSLVSHNVFGFLAAKHHQLAEAESQYLQALQIWPADATILFNLGNLYMQSRPDRALDCYAMAVQYQPKFVPYRNSLAAALARTGHAKEAYDQWRQAIAIDPDYIDAHNNLGDLLLNVGRPDEAAAEYHEALRIDPKNAHVIERLHGLESPRGK